MTTEMGNNRKEDELTPQERRFCALRVQGYSQTQAWRVAYDRPRTKGSTASSAASVVANKPRVYAYVKSLYREAKKSDVLSHTDWLQQMVDAFDKSIAEGNLTAAASFGRLMGQGIGTLSDSININDERPSAETLVNTLAQDDPQLAALLSKKLSGRQDFDA